MVSTGDFPQADKLLQVGQVANAVAQGNHEDNDIEAFIGLSSGGRQGRYYRLAAQNLGLIKTANNYSSLSALGAEYASLQTKAARLDFLAQCLVETSVFKSALQYIYKHSPTEPQLQAWFRAFYPGSTNTANRRFTTFKNYLKEADLIELKSTKLKVKKYVGGILKQESPDKKLVGTAVEKIVKVNPKISDAKVISVDVDLQKLERANNIHYKLVSSKAAYLQKLGYFPQENKHIDLYTSSGKNTVFYEMKSINVGNKNFLPQVRKAISQLYEYRYIFNEPKAKACIVTNAEISSKDKWVYDYLAKDRLIGYEWTDDFSTFNSEGSTKKILGEFIK